MGESYEIKFNLTATNKAMLDDILAKLKQTGPAAGEASQGFEKFADSVKNLIQNPLQSAGNMAGDFITKLGPMGSAAVGAAGAFAAIGKAGLDAMGSLGQLGTEIHNISLRTGFTTKEVGQFSFAAKIAGTDVGVFEMAMRRLSMGLAESGTQGKQARESMERLGISTKEPKEVFIQVADVMSRMSSVAERNALALQLFGRAGLELVPVMMSLNASLREAKEMDLGVSDKDIAQWEKYHHEMVVIETMWDKMKRKMKEGIAAPVYWFLGGDEDLITAPKNAMGFDNGAGDPDAYAAKAAKYAQRFIREALSKGNLKMASGGLRIADIEGLGYASSARTFEADRSAYGRTKEGAEANLKGAQQNVQDKFDAYESSKDKGTVIANAARKACEDAKNEAAKYKGTIDSITASEKHVADLAAFHKTATESGQSTVAKMLSSDPNGRHGADALRMLYGDAGSFMAYGSTLGEAITQAQKANPTASFGMIGTQYLKSQSDVSALGVTADSDATKGRAQYQKEASALFVKTLREDQLAGGKGLEEDLKSMREVALGDKAEGQQHTYAMAMTGGASPAQAATLQYKQRLAFAVEIFDTEKKLAADSGKQFDLVKAQTDYRIAGIKAVNEYEEKIAQLHSAQVQSLQSGVFKALMGGGAGMKQFATGLGTQTLEGIFTNVTREPFSKLVTEMGKVGGASGLGKYLGGTMFDPMNAGKVQMSAADTQLAAAKTMLTAVSRLGSGGALGGARGFSTSGTGWSGGGATADNGGWEGSGDASTTDDFGNPSVDEYGNPGNAPSYSVPNSGGSSAWASNVGKGVAVAGGAMLAINGLMRGGAKGDLQGVAGMAMAIAPFTGPAAPFIMAGAAGLQMISSLLGDPVVKRQNELRQEAQARGYAAPTGTSYNVDSYGQKLDQGANGQPRIVNYFSFQALDMKSLVDRKNEIAEIVRMGVNSYAPLRREIIAASSY